MMNSRSKQIGLLLIVSLLLGVRIEVAAAYTLNQPVKKQNRQKKKVKSKGWWCATAYEIRIVNTDAEIVDQTTGGATVGKLLRKVEPGYPTQAVIERVQGIVIIEAIVSETGDVDSIKNVSGPPSLMKASAEAAKKWRFTPTTVKGAPVQALAKITFTYDLGKR